MTMTRDKRVSVDAGALRMVLNALRRDAEEGRAARGEMADELEKTCSALAERALEPQGQALPEFADAVKQLRSALSAMMTQFGMDEDETSAGTFKQARKACDDTANIPDFAALYGETAVQNAELRIAIGAFGMTHEQAVERASQLALPAGPVPEESNEWIAQAKLTLDRLGSFLQRIGAPHAVAWRDWIDNAEHHVLAMACREPAADSFGAILSPFMNEQKIADLKTLDTASDFDDDHAVSADRMDDLAEVGLIRVRTGRRFHFTDLGLSALSHYANPDRHSPAVAQPVADERDTQRLDFIEANPSLRLTYHKKRWALIGLTGYAYQVFKTAREAIDDARAALCQPAEEGGKS